MFKLHPLFLSLIAAQGIVAPVSYSLAATLKPFSPYLNDNKAGVFCVCNGSTQTLSGNQQFAEGLSSAQSFTLGELQSYGGRTDYSLVGKPRLDPGGADYIITIPDPDGSGNNTFNVFSSAGMTELPTIGLDTEVPNYIDVAGGQYINARVAQVSKGTINVDIGEAGALTSASSNGWRMAAKQSQLFTATGSGNMNWESDNRITFTTVRPPYGGIYYTYPVDNVAFYQGAFSVTTRDGVTTNFNVTSFDGFKNYNDWLIQQLESGNLSTDSYRSELDKALILTSGDIVYTTVARNPYDEAEQPVGELVVLSADGPKATVRVKAGATLEVARASSAVQASNGATAIIEGKVSATGDGTTDGSALTLLSGSKGINKGVINGGFFNQADGTGVDGGTADRIYGAVKLQDESHFINKGVINTAGGSTALDVYSGSAINKGNINAGVANGSSASGVYVAGEDASFVNAASGTIYLGRSPQNSLKDETTDVYLSESVGVSVNSGGSAINNGRIVLGSLTQSSVAMQAQSGSDTLLQNNGTIDINGAATFQPGENIALSVVDSGSGGLTGNAGTLNLNGDNGTGIKVLATSGNSASAWSDGTINLNGRADPLNGTWNTGVWVIGEEGGSARATINGPVNMGGTGALGIRVEGNATVDTRNMFNFSGGQDQVGYMVIGPEAKLNLPQNGRYGVYDSAWYSTIFSYQNGAKFDGSGMTITPDASFSTGISGSGGGTQVDTNGATLNVGLYSTGLRISNGARATIDAATQFSLTSFNSTGALVDGNNNDGTLLTNHADISGFFSGEVGLAAQNKGQIVNTGNISLAGEEARGIRAESSSSVDNSGTIDVSNGSVALYATGYYFSGDGYTPTAITNTGTLNITAGTAYDFFPTHGAVAYGPLGQVYQNGTVNLYGSNAMAGEAFSEGTLYLGETGTVNFHDGGQTAYQAADYFSMIISNGGTSDVSTDNSTFYRLRDGAWLNSISPATITLSGANSTGINAAGQYTNVAATDRFVVNGEGATAARISDGAIASINNPIELNGNSSLGVIADGETTSVNSVGGITGSGANATAYEISNGAILSNRSQVNLTGSNATGLRIHNGGSYFEQSQILVASGVGMEVTEGIAQYFPESAQLKSGGTAAVRIGNNGSLTVFGDGTFRSSIEGNSGADAILLDKGAAGLTVNTATLDAYDGGSAINNRAEISNIALNNIAIYARGNGGSAIRSATSFDPGGSAYITVSGGATGYTFANADGSTTGNDLTIGRGYVILASSGSSAVRANTTGRVFSNGNIYITNESGGSAIVTSTASEVINRGEIYSWSTVAPVIDLRGGDTVFINEGTIGTQYADTPLILGGAGSDQIALVDGAVNGNIDTGEGTDTLALTGGAVNGSVTMGGGVDNQAYVQNVSLANVSHITTAGGEGSTLSLSDIAASGGSFASDDISRGVNLGAGWSVINFYGTDWTLTDNLKLAHSTINIDGGSTLYAGNGIRPVLEGGTNDSLMVNNAGTLDLTNGTGLANDILTLNGTLNSLYGTLKLNSALNGGGEPGNQSSDTLRVNGDANGVTLIEVTPAAGSSGTLSDVNQNGISEANEGTSLAQVSGSSNADSFALKGGYLAGGPWRYDLYSFAPGSSDASQRLVDGSGSQFWDYRLANGFVSNGTASRAAVVPQVPSYVSAPVGLAWYAAATLNDLHNRLGELREGQPGDSGEMFLRYTGANMRYQTSQSFRDFGYNFDMDYSALQVGGNVLRMDGADGSLRGGVAWTRGNSRIRPHAADGYSSTAFDSDTLSLYSSWLQQSGFWLDGTLSYSWHRGETDIARQQKVAKIKGKGWSASLESGYPFALGNGFRLEPQAQLTYLHLGLDNFSDKDNLAVNYDDYNQTVGRVGAKLDRRWSDEGGRQYTPYLRANYYKGWGSQAKTRVGAKGVDGLEQTFRSGKFGQMWETGLGGTVTFRNNLSLYAEADYRKEIDGNGGKGWGYNAGVKWTF